MQTPKARNCPSEARQKISPRVISSEVASRISPRAVSSEVPQKLSPRVISSEVAPRISPRVVSSEVPPKLSPRVVRQLRTSSKESDSSSSSSNRASRTPKDRSSKVGDRKLPRSPVSEKKHPNRVAELEFQISQLQSDLKNAKEQLDSSEARKKQAQEDAEESKKQLLAMSIKLEESQQQVLEHSGSTEANVIDQKKVSEDSDLALQFQLEAFKKQHSIESAALASAVNEIKELKIQLETVAESEATQTKQAEMAQSELNCWKENLTETLGLMEDMKKQLRDCKESESQAQGLVGETLIQLETAKKTVETLRSDGIKSVGAYDAIALELEKSRARVYVLEALVNELNADINTAGGDDSKTSGDLKLELKNRERDKLRNSIEKEFTSLKSEVEQLRSALEAAEIRYNEEQTQSAIQLKSASALVEQIKSSSIAREAELESQLHKSRVEVEELKANLMDKETELQGICEENEDLNMRLEKILPGQKEFDFGKEIQKAKASIENLKANLMDKETELQNILEENEILKLELRKKEFNSGEVNDKIARELEAARAAERDALMKLRCLTEEVEKSNWRVARVSEQLEGAQTASSEMEAELRRLKVQSDQWRKAAEAAAAVLATGNNGKVMERTGSMDGKYSPRSGRITSPNSEDGNDDFLKEKSPIKKKSPIMLKKIGVLWKKPQK